MGYTHLPVARAVRITHGDQRVDVDDADLRDYIDVHAFLRGMCEGEREVSKAPPEYRSWFR